MEPLLLLVHRIPFPPNKGDKIPSYHLLRHLARRYAVHLGTFVDYFDSLVGWERFRASQFGIRHFCTIALEEATAC